MIKTGKELAAACEKVAKDYKTLYVMGCFGAPMNAKNKARYTTNTSYNKDATRTAMINAASADTFGFDCVCLIKGLLWVWCGDPSQVYGGAAYKSNGVPDISDSGMIAACSDVSTDFSNIEVGEMVWMKGHCGVYIGNGLAVECTPKWENKVQITACNCSKAGYNRRDWTKHGKLPYVEYTAEQQTVIDTDTEEGFEMKLNTIKKGSTGGQVSAMQAMLVGFGYDLGKTGVDGDFGEATETALKKYQSQHNLEVDGVCGPNTWTSLFSGTKAVEPAPAPVEPEKEWVPNVGDIVYFKGGLQYSQSNGTAGSQKEAGQAKITKVYNGKHPYHLVRTGKTGPYGWVDRNTFTKV